MNIVRATSESDHPHTALRVVPGR